MRKNNPSPIRFVLFFFCSLIFFSSESTAERKIRIHFVAASFGYAKDEAENSKLAAFSSRAGYDAVWEASVPSGFPTSFGLPKQVSGSGLSQSRTKDGLQDCDAELSFRAESNKPGANVYNINGDKYAIQIVAPHASLLSSSQINACNGPLFVVSAPGEGVTTTPDYTGIPNEAGGSSPPPISQYAAFVVDADKPESTVNFAYVQTTNFPQLKYTSKSVWFGYVNVELNPSKQLPGSIDPLKLFDYTPPESFQPPPDPPSGGSTGGGGGSSGGTITTKQITKFIRDPIIKQVVDALQALQQVWTSISQAQSSERSSKPRLYSDPESRFSYEPSTRQLTVSSVSGAPGDGTASFKIAIGDGSAKSAGKGIAITSSTEEITLTLPSSLITVFNKGKKTPLEITASFVASSNKKVKATISKKISLKKRA